MVWRILTVAVFMIGWLAGTVSAGESEDRFFELYDLSGKLYRLAHVAQQEDVKVVVVDFFWDGCQPCKKALPKWKKLFDMYHDKGLRIVIVGIRAGDDLKEARKKLKAYFTEHPVPFPVVFDKYNMVAKQYGVVGADNSVSLPQVFLLGKDGTLFLQTEKSDEAIRKAEQLLSGPPTIPPK
jgi:peroxiredoxin